MSVIWKDGFIRKCSCFSNSPQIKHVCQMSKNHILRSSKERPSALKEHNKCSFKRALFWLLRKRFFLHKINYLSSLLTAKTMRLFLISLPMLLSQSEVIIANQ